MGCSGKELSERISNKASEEYNTSVYHDCATCNGGVLLKALYNNSWNTPMAGAPFRLYLDGELIEENRLKSISDLGKDYKDELTDEERLQLGTFLKEDVGEGELVFEILAEGTEAQVLELEDTIEGQADQIEKDTRTQYANEWMEWNKASTVGKGSELLVSATEGFLRGIEEWLESEAGFWESIGDFLADTWDGLVSILDDLIDALHPDNIFNTLDDIWKAAKNSAFMAQEFISTLDDRLQELYEGAIAIYENIDAITKFITDFATGNLAGVEEFIENKLHLLVGEDRAQELAKTLQGNAEGWALVIEVIGHTRVPSLLVASVMKVIKSIPPQVYAGIGVVSLVLIGIEIIISVILSYLMAATAVLSAGTAVSVTVIVGRLAKAGKVAKTATTIIEPIFKKLTPIMENLIALGQNGVYARRMHAAENVISDPFNNRRTLTQERSGSEDKERGEKCKVCNKVLGKNGHPSKSPKYERSNETKSYRDNIKQKVYLKNSQSLGFSWPTGKIAVHHLVSKNSMALTKLTTSYSRLGYNINDSNNLAVLPSWERLACHLQCALHREPHPEKYDLEILNQLKPITTNIKNSSYCKQPKKNIQEDVNKISAYIAMNISRFDKKYLITSNGYKYKPLDKRGCSNYDNVNSEEDYCEENRDHCEFSDITAGLTIPYKIEAGK